MINLNANRAMARTMVILARAGKIARVSYNSNNPALNNNKLVGDIEDKAKDLSALELVTFTLAQFAQDGFDGVIDLYTTEDVCTRAYEYLGLVKKGDDFSSMVKDWMTDEWSDAVINFIEAATACNAHVKFTTIKNAVAWDLTPECLADIKGLGIVIPEGTELEFKDGIAKYTYYDNDTNKFVVDIVSRLNLGGETSRQTKYTTCFYNNEVSLARPNNSSKMISVLKAIDIARELCPVIELDVKNMVEGDSY